MYHQSQTDRNSTISRRKKGSKKRHKAKRKLAKLHEKVINQRNDFLHKQTTTLVKNYSVLALEKLKTTNMLKNHNLAKSIQDVSWSKFTNMLCYKAENAGCKVLFVNPKNTTKKCSNCGILKAMELSERIYNCPVCGMIMDRDLNAAINIITTAGLAGSHASEENVRPQLAEATLDERGTTHPKTAIS